MGTKAVKKGILKKPMKYFSTMFDNNKEPEMQIGLPTDVKHVAHIGWDGPNLTAPTWMNEYHSAPLAATGNPWGSQDSIEDNMARPAPLSPNTSSSAAAAADNPADPTDQPNTAPASTRPRHSRRPQSDGTITTDSQSREATEGSTKRGRRKHKKEGTSTTTDAQGQEVPGLPKHSHRRRTKGSSTGSGEFVKTSKIKASAAKTVQDEQSDDKNTTMDAPAAAESFNGTKENEEDDL